MSDDAGLRAWSHFLGAHALAIRAVEARLKAAGLPPLGWYDVLLELDRAGRRLRIGELAERLIVAPYTMTRLLDRLEEAGLLRREKAPGDRRGAYAVLTTEGEAARRRMWPHYQRAILELFGAALSERDAEDLVRIFKKVIARLRAGKAPPECV